MVALFLSTRGGSTRLEPSVNYTRVRCIPGTSPLYALKASSSFSSDTLATTIACRLQPQTAAIATLGTSPSCSVPSDESMSSCRRPMTSFGDALLAHRPSAIRHHEPACAALSNGWFIQMPLMEDLALPASWCRLGLFLLRLFDFLLVSVVAFGHNGMRVVGCVRSVAASAASCNTRLATFWNWLSNLLFPSWKALQGGRLLLNRNLSRRWPPRSS